MDLDLAVEVLRRGLWVGFMVAGPLLIGSLVVGLLVSIFQAVTQIHEMTITFVPKILTVMILFALLLPWFLMVMVGFSRDLFLLIPRVVAKG